MPLLAVWVGTEVIGFPGIGAWLFGRWGALPNGAYTLPLLALPGLLWAYRKKLPVTVALYAPLLVWWVILQPVAWQWEINPVYFIGGVGGLFLLIAESHRSGSPFAVPYRLYGALLSAGALVPLSFIEFNRDILRHDFTGAGLATTLVIVALGGATIALAAVLSRKYDPEQKPIGDHLVAIIRQQWLPIGVMLLMAFLALWDTLPSPQDPAAVLPTVLANVAMIFVAFWVMHSDLRDDRVIPFAAGVAYFLLWIVLRYVDLFGDLGGMLGASLMFFLCGATLFGVAVYWRKRKEIRHV